MIRPPATFRLGEFHEKDPDDYHNKEDYNPFGQGSHTWKVFCFVHERTSRKRKVIKLQKSYGRTAEEARRGLEKATEREWRCISRENYRVIKHREKAKREERRKARLLRKQNVNTNENTTGTN